MTLHPIHDDLVALFERQTAALGRAAPPVLGGDGSSAASHRLTPARIRSLAAACLLIVAGGVAVWTFGSRDGAIGVTEARVMPQPPPLVALDAPGWELVDYEETSATQFGATSIVFVDPGLGVGGPWLSVTAGDVRPVVGFGESSDAEVGGVPARVRHDDHRSTVRWTPAGSGVEVVVRAWSIGPEDALAVARQVTLGDGGAPTLAGNPLGLVPLGAAGTALLDRTITYTWRSADGTLLQLGLMPGGEAARFDREATTARRETVETELRGAPAQVAADGQASPRRLRQLNGFWLWEVSGYRNGLARGPGVYPDGQSFIDLANLLTVTDDATWRAALPADVVLIDGVDAVVRELSADLERADESPVAPFPDLGVIATRDALAAWVAADAACGWTQVLRAAVAAGDDRAVAAVVSTLRGIGDWDELAPVLDDGAADVIGIPGAIALIDTWAADQAADDAAVLPFDEIELRLGCSRHSLSAGG